jgi:hypothetical protein
VALNYDLIGSKVPTPGLPIYKVDAIGCVADAGIRVGLAAHFVGVLPIRYLGPVRVNRSFEASS